jgi:hypothetical protein
VTENRFDTAATDWDKEKLRIELAKAISSRIALLPLHDDMRAMGVMHHGLNREKLTGNLKRLGFSSIHVNTVHTIRRKNSQGDEKPYPVFLLTALKEKQ